MSNQINRKKRYGHYVIEEGKDLFFYKFTPEKQMFNFIVKGEPNEYFKGNSKHALDVSELFACQLAKAVNYKILEQYPAIFVDNMGRTYEGTLSIDYIKDREKIEVLASSDILKFYFNNADRIIENAMENHHEAAKYYIAYINEMNKENENLKPLTLDKNFVKDLQKLRLFSRLIFAEYTRLTKTEYQIENNELKLGVPFDFSNSFLLKSFTSNLRDNFKNIQTQEQSLIEKEIAEAILKDDELKQFFTCFKTVNLKNLLLDYKHKNEFHFIDEEDIEIADLVLKTSIKQVEKALENEAIVQNNPLYNSTNQYVKFRDKDSLNYNETLLKTDKQLEN